MEAKAKPTNGTLMRAWSSDVAVASSFFSSPSPSCSRRELTSPTGCGDSRACLRAVWAQIWGRGGKATFPWKYRRFCNMLRLVGCGRPSILEAENAQLRVQIAVLERRATAREIVHLAFRIHPSLPSRITAHEDWRNRSLPRATDRCLACLESRAAHAHTDSRLLHQPGMRETRHSGAITLPTALKCFVPTCTVYTVSTHALPPCISGNVLLARLEYSMRMPGGLGCRYDARYKNRQTILCSLCPSRFRIICWMQRRGKKKVNFLLCLGMDDCIF